jgi:hypothetical protein
MSLRGAFPSTKVQDRFCDEAISTVTQGDCAPKKTGVGKKRLAMTNWWLGDRLEINDIGYFSYN